MTLPKIITIITILLFSTLGVVALFKSQPQHPTTAQNTPTQQAPLEIKLDRAEQILTPAPQAEVAITQPNPEPASHSNPTPTLSLPEPEEVDRIAELFNLEEPKLPIVETITYKSRVAWQKGRPAWLSDYANHYNTSRHFIARSLNGEPNYLKQELKEGQRFNVLRSDVNFQFYLIVDTSRCKMWFYYKDLDRNQATLLKTYHVGLGRLDSSKTPGTCDAHNGHFFAFMNFEADPL